MITKVFITLRPIMQYVTLKSGALESVTRLFLFLNSDFRGFGSRKCYLKLRKKVFNTLIEKNICHDTKGGGRGPKSAQNVSGNILMAPIFM